MRNLLISEWIKFRKSSIFYLSFLALLLPALLSFMGVFVQRQNYGLESFFFNLENLSNILVFPVLASFTSVFSISGEYQHNTMRNLLLSPRGRVEILLAKILFSISAFLLITFISSLIAAAAGLFLREAGDGGEFLRFLAVMNIGALASVPLVPLTVLLTLVVKGFIPPLLLGVIGALGNIFIIHHEASYLYPWAASSVIGFSLNGAQEGNIEALLLTICISFVSLVIGSLFLFQFQDQR